MTGEDRQLPVIRLSEVYYILCEYLANKDLSKGNQLLQELRVARGAKTALDPAMPKDKFLEAVYNERHESSLLKVRPSICINV